MSSCRLYQYQSNVYYKKVFLLITFFNKVRWQLRKADIPRIHFCLLFLASQFHEMPAMYYNMALVFCAQFEESFMKRHSVVSIHADMVYFGNKNTLYLISFTDDFFSFLLMAHFYWVYSVLLLLMSSNFHYKSFEISKERVSKHTVVQTEGRSYAIILPWSNHVWYLLSTSMQPDGDLVTKLPGLYRKSTQPLK